MPRGAEALHRIREESRERILDSALELFGRHGFASTSVRMLAEHAGVSQGLLYNYFDGKLDLLRAIIERSVTEVQATLAEAVAAAPSESLAVLIRAAFEAVARDPDFWRLTYQIRMQPEVLADVGEELIASAEQIRFALEELLSRAGVREAKVRSRVVFGAIDGVAQHYVLDADHYPMDAVAAEMIELLVPVPRRRRRKA